MKFNRAVKLSPGSRSLNTDFFFQEISIDWGKYTNLNCYFVTGFFLVMEVVLMERRQQHPLEDH